MEEEKKEEMQEEKISASAEELKNETFEAAKKVKESMKGTDFKEETKATKGFIIDMFKDPLEKIKEVATENDGKYLKTAIILIVLWTVIVFVRSSYTTIHLWGFMRIFENILSVLKSILAPVCIVAVYSLIAFLMNKDNKKSLITVISTISIAQLPRIIASLASLLTIFSSRISTITSPFSSLCYALSVVLTFFGLKHIFGTEKCTEFFKKYMLIVLIYEAVGILVGLLGISI